MSPAEEALLTCVTDEAATATQIWRRLLNIPPGPFSLTRRHRRERLSVAFGLERLAYAGHIQKTWINRHGALIPAYHSR
jgi:hypothetical protein